MNKIHKVKNQTYNHDDGNKETCFTLSIYEI